MKDSPYSPAELQQLALQQQLLCQDATDPLAVVRHLGYVQIDSINVVERAHHHVMFSRMPKYQPQMLANLMADKQVFEYWSHAAAFLPMEAFRFSLFRKQQLQQGDKHWFEPDHQAMRDVMARISAEGPLKASDFNHKGAQTSGWWDWKPAKKALEQLFMQGQLMVVRRDKFQKVFDLAERVLPSTTDTRTPTSAEFARHLIEGFLQANGFGSLAQICYQRKGIRAAVKTELQHMCEAGAIREFSLGQQSYYVDLRLSLQQQIPDNVSLLNPFDNLLIQRQRLAQCFGFDFQVEFYLPAEKRRYGYYALPILWRDQFVGRLDVKADRQQRLLQLPRLSLNEDFIPDEAFIGALQRAIGGYAGFNNCDSWQLLSCKHKRLIKCFSGSH
ncbi:winged helix DNA-binding domain-containing protein [Shewanella sp. AS16]|uniref:winged helix-turn-helix domain-containing protein n=1 Tax=Shewanella sp. AS16 TaxID=2907625 RepID=UPI001F1966C4|nr:crosslink repair DNA glycosylase YcaQ family protein [Shewanella sp. AS16]MCE9688070.1 winged helix DNA-binding domain-containing protein [Shewanella sp. AS16]